MQQHPIPQNVTQYQFRLVGDMTLKQFLELALGLVLAYFFYASNLVFFIKWPFVILSLFLGFGLAFFPIEERPLDVWITNFLRSIYAPTRYIWKKTFRLPSLFQFVPSVRESTVTAVKTVKAPVLTRPASSTTDFSDLELARVNSIDSLFKASPPMPKTPSPQSPALPQSKPSIKVRALNPASVIFDSSRVTPPPESRPAVAPSTPVREINIPILDNLTIPKPAPVAPPQTVSQDPTPAPAVKVVKPASPSVAPKTINLPAPPKSPNMVVGMVVDSADKMVENAIVQILDQKGIPARAIKTNSLGQFYISTPLGNGDYIIEIEKEGLNFSPARLTTKGDLIPPLLIKAA